MNHFTYIYNRLFL